jgi:hypothetical protein
MGANAKRKTTMAKLNRERKLLEKRAEKSARKAARKLEAAQPADETPEPFGDETPEPFADEALSSHGTP